MSAPECSSPPLLPCIGIAGIGIAIGGGDDGIAIGGGDDGMGAAGANIGAGIGGAGAIDEGMESGIEAGIGSGADELRSDAPVTTAIGGGSGNPIGLVECWVGLAGGTDALGLAGRTEAPDASVGLGGDTDGDGTVRGATDGGAGGAIDGARGAIGALLARMGLDPWLARGAIDAGRAAVAGARGAGGSVMRRVPGATLTGGGLSFTALTGADAASRALVSSASASAMSGGRPCAVAASS